MDPGTPSNGEDETGGLRLVGCVKRRWRKVVGDDNNRREKIIYEVLFGTRTALMTQWKGDESIIIAIGTTINMPVRVNAYMARGNRALYELLLDDGQNAMLGQAF